MAAIAAPPIRVILRSFPRKATVDPTWIKWTVIGVMFLFMILFLILPLVLIFKEALAKGWEVCLKTFDDDTTAHAIRLTLITAAIAVPLNTIFGVSAAWLLSCFQFKGRTFLSSIIDLPLWVSPVIGGLIYVSLFGAQGLWGQWFQAHDIKIIFALPGIVIATLFVTFSFVARTVIPLMQSQGKAEEEAALTLGANGWQVFFRVTLPKIKWALLYGIILCNARAMGEFGAVSVVSGHIRGETNTMPLHIEILYNEYQFAAAFTVASLLSLLALITLIIKTYSEWRTEQQLRIAQNLV